MSNYLSIKKAELQDILKNLNIEYKEFKSRNLNLDMSRGKPCLDQIKISSPMLDVITSTSECKTETNIDCRNYGLYDGIPEIKRLFAEIMDVNASEVIVGGNSSLNMMFDFISCCMTHGIKGCEPWIKQDKVKFLCPAPGYDRHFDISSYFGMELISVPMTKFGPDMDIIEELIKNDKQIKGVWCIPKYSNPTGITYSDETVRRFAKLNPAARDFCIIWDNAYAIHDINDSPDELLGIMGECIKVNSQDMLVIFCSTSKVTFSGSGVAAMAAAEPILSQMRERYRIQTIGFDKINQLRHILFFENYGGILNHMEKNREILEPKFEAVLKILDKNFHDNPVISWTKPNGGYFISVDVYPNCAKRVVKLCKDAGVLLTPAGATYPNRLDPKDSNIRLSPTCPPVDELNTAMELFCLCVKIAILEKIINI